MKIYKIKWIDAISDSDWMTIENTKRWAKKNMNILSTSVGYILESNKEYTIIAGSYDGSDHYGEKILIPKSLIVKQEVIHSENDK